ncbi:MAG: tetratricopeptide repeat protein, partial [Gemmataceae bacterium]|nr:tetratricopeptide repeat protein [Gemmataceae bacterium]
MGAIREKVTNCVRRRPEQTFFGLLVALILLGFFGYDYYRASEARSRYRAALDAADRRDWKAVLASLKEAQQIEADNPDHLLLAARAERRLERLPVAEDILKTCASKQGETQRIKVERALIRVHKGELTAVEPFLKSCLEQNDPDAEEILDIYTAALELDTRFAEAQRLLDELLRRRPNDFHVISRRGRAARGMGWNEDAAKYYEQALALRPEENNVRLALAEVQLALGRFGPARDN